MKRLLVVSIFTTGCLCCLPWSGRSEVPAQTIELVSVHSNGTQGHGWSAWLSISSDGRFVAFDSDASNLVDDDTNGEGDVFVWERAPTSGDGGGGGGCFIGAAANSLGS